jgi:hypothetical protein
MAAPRWVEIGNDGPDGCPQNHAQARLGNGYDGADRRLLVDFSALPAVDVEHRQRRYPTRATFTIRDEATIERFLSEMSVGDVAEATGSFEQGNYVPYRTTCIDTTFLLEDFRKIQKPARRKSYRVPAPVAEQDTPLLH